MTKLLVLLSLLAAGSGVMIAALGFASGHEDEGAAAAIGSAALIWWAGCKLGGMDKSKE